MDITTHVVPRFFPTIDGVGDYALNLARNLRKECEVDSAFLVCDPEWRGPDQIEEFQIRHLAERSSQCLGEELSALYRPIILHYSGYGYDRWGLPFWLRDGLKSSAGKILTIFHELWSSGFPWQSAFYCHLWQRKLVRRLERLSHLSITSTKRMHDLLRDDALLLPIPSNLPLLTRRTGGKASSGLRPLIFGQAGPRRVTIKLHRTLLHELGKRGLLDAVIIAGKDAGAPDVEELGRSLPVRVRRNPNPSEAAEEFADASFYLSGYPASLICKSTTFMAALASGCPPVLSEGRNAEPLVEGKHFLVCNGLSTEVDRLLRDLESGAPREGQNWYRQNADWTVVAPRIGKLIGEMAWSNS